MKRLIKLVLLLLVLAFACYLSSFTSLRKYEELKARYDAVVAERDALLQGIIPDAPTDGSAGSTRPDTFDGEAVLAQLEAREYHYRNEYWQYAFLAVKNNSDFTLEISANATFVNSAGKLVGAKSAYEVAVGSGTEAILCFMPDEEYAEMDYELSAKPDKYFESVRQDLSWERSSAASKEIVSVTNNGDEAAEFVECYVLFFKGDTLVNHEWTYFVDSDSKIKPGKTITQEIYCPQDYDSVQIFLNGRK